jgi:adenine-specific DNA-methyltransferase
MTELIWDGKYDANGKKVAPVRIDLPFQNIETVNESAEDRKHSFDIFAKGGETEWRNRLIWGDKKYVLPSLLPEFAGKVNLIYIDPPFDTGADFSFDAIIPDDPDDENDEYTSFTKEPSMIETKAYRDTWGKGLDSYLHWFYETIVLLRELLAEEGSLFVHLDWHLGHYAKVVIDEVFGPDKLRNEIIWRRANAKTTDAKIGVLHDTLYWFSKGTNPTYNRQYHKFADDYLKSKFPHSDPDGRRYQLQPLHGKGTGPARKFGKKTLSPPPGRHWSWSQERIDGGLERGIIVLPREDSTYPRYKDYFEGKAGIPLTTIWNDIPDVNSQAAERVSYPTQKPEGLLDRVISACSNSDDLVLDCFCGSGTTAAVAEKLGRRWITCDLGRFAIHTTRKRLLEIKGLKPFVVQNLGKYERQVWAAAELGQPPPGPRLGKAGELEERAQAELTYRNFILDLYAAEPVAGYTWLHGAKAGRMVHVGAVDSPVAIGDIKSIVQEFWRVAGKSKHQATNGVDVLGWEFAFDINETARQIAAEHKIDLKTKKIPREVLEKKAVEQGDIKFYELAYLNVKSKIAKRTVTLELKDFIMPPDDIPTDVLDKITHWSQWIDYWAVDWDFKEDTFHNQWQSYRTKKEPKIELSIKHDYETSGTYTVLVKVIDILGNDTTKTLEVKI